MQSPCTVYNYHVSANALLGDKVKGAFPSIWLTKPPLINTFRVIDNGMQQLESMHAITVWRTSLLANNLKRQIGEDIASIQPSGIAEPGTCLKPEYPSPV
jgi:hypothetical protein